jgi:CubicO group peptidase (beta-lactamase class C family)
VTNNQAGAYFARGIYGQWIFVSPSNRVVIVKQASPPTVSWSREVVRFELESLGALADRVEHVGDGVIDAPMLDNGALAIGRFISQPRSSGGGGSL